MRSEPDTAHAGICASTGTAGTPCWSSTARSTSSRRWTSCRSWTRRRDVPARRSCSICGTSSSSTARACACSTGPGSRVLDRGGRLRLVCTHPLTLRILQVTGLDALLPPLSTLDEALGQPEATSGSV